jgi:hypothetical protein
MIYNNFKSLWERHCCAGRFKGKNSYSAGSDSPGKYSESFSMIPGISEGRAADLQWQKYNPTSVLR